MKGASAGEALGARCGHPATARPSAERRPSATSLRAPARGDLERHPVGAASGGGALSRPAVAGPYAGRATLAAGIDARGAVLTAWSEQVCGTECARVHVRSASRASGATRFSAVQTLDDGRSGRPTLIAIAHRTLITITRNR